MKAGGWCENLWAGLGIEKKRAEANFKIYSAPHLADKIVSVRYENRKHDHKRPHVISLALTLIERLEASKGLFNTDSAVKSGLTVFAVRRERKKRDKRDIPQGHEG